MSLAPMLSAQTMYKCKDSGGRITYSNIPCDKQALETVGIVAERTTTLPLPLPVAPAARPGDKKDDPAKPSGQAK